MIITPDLIKACYRVGLFPMAKSKDSYDFHLVCPKNRALLSIEALHVPKSLTRRIRKNSDGFEVTVDQAFDEVIAACAEKRPERPDTWINEPIEDLFCAMHREGIAHSVEVWQGERLVGGLYGLRMGAVFFGESMFSHVSEASKTALVHLAARLWRGGFKVLDVQFTNDHLKQFGVYEVPHDSYLEILDAGLKADGDFILRGDPLEERARVMLYLNHISESQDQ